jgi:hypothetical protein
MTCGEHELPLPEVDHADLARQIRRHEAIDQRPERIQLARFGNEWL